MPEMGAQIINPEAGSHPVTSHPREIEACIRAGERSWREWPYYAARFGERGRRFGHSDSGWIALLVHSPPPVVNAEITWLSRLLSARGMPQLMMERHLELLHDELAAAVPERREAYAKLLRSAEMLRAERRALVPDAELSRLAAAFEAAAAVEPAERIERFGELLVSAAMDERLGIERGVIDIEAWATDASRFPPPWIDAVRQTLAAARAAMPPAAG